VNQKKTYKSEQNEVDGTKKGADSTRRYLKERLMICNEEDTDGGGRRDEKWVQ